MTVYEHLSAQIINFHNTPAFGSDKLQHSLKLWDHLKGNIFI